MPTTERVFQIFKELKQIPRPSHHEERVADYLCQFAERLHLPYRSLKKETFGSLFFSAWDSHPRVLSVALPTATHCNCSPITLSITSITWSPVQWLV